MKLPQIPIFTTTTTALGLRLSSTHLAQAQEHSFQLSTWADWNCGGDLTGAYLIPEIPSVGVWSGSHMAAHGTLNNSKRDATEMHPILDHCTLLPVSKKRVVKTAPFFISNTYWDTRKIKMSTPIYQTIRFNSPLLCYYPHSRPPTLIQSHRPTKASLCIP